MRPSRLATSAALVFALAATSAATLAGCKDASPPPAPAPAPVEPVVIAAEQPGPSAVAIDADFIYWNHAGRSLIRKAPRRGGAAITLFDGGGELGGHSIAVDRDAVYFDRGFEVMRVPVAGGPATHVADIPSVPAVVVADDDAVYVATYSSIVRHPKRGGESRAVGSDGSIWDVAVDATHVYWVSETGVRRVAKSGGVAELLARGRFRFSRIALDDTTVYWGDAVLEGVLAVPKQGGASRFVSHAWQIGAQRLVLAQRAIWVMHVDGKLDRIDPDTGTGAVIAVALSRGGSADHFHGLAVTASDIFVAAGGSTLVGAGPVHIDLTQPGAKLPEFSYGGEVLRLPTSPQTSIRTDAALPEIARVWFTGATMQDSGNAIRWIANLDDDLVDRVRRGKLGLRLVAFASETVPQATATERGQLVADTIRDQLGGSPRITITAARSPTYHGDVHVTLDPADLSAALSPTR